MTMYGGHMTTPHIGKRLETARRLKGMPKAKLARNTGIPEKTLARRWEHPSQFSIAELSAVCTALDVTIEQIVASTPTVADLITGSA